ncbi:response regulator [Thiovibrio sp. JS02]
MQEAVRILCVDDEVNVLRALERLFLDEEYEILRACSGEEGLEILEAEPAVQVVLSDYRMPGMNGVDFLKKVCALRPDTVRIVLSGYADTAAVVEAINEGKIYKFIPKPWNDDELKVTISKALDFYFLQKKNRELTEDLSASNEELRLLNENLEQLVRERTEELLFQNRVLRHSQFILDALPVGVLGLDVDNAIVQCNHSAGEVIGTACGVLTGTRAREVLPRALVDLLAELKAGETMLAQVDFPSGAMVVRARHMKGEEGQEGTVLVLEPVGR